MNKTKINKIEKALNEVGLKIDGVEYSGISLLHTILTTQIKQDVSDFGNGDTVLAARSLNTLTNSYLKVINIFQSLIDSGK